MDAKLPHREKLRLAIEAEAAARQALDDARNAGRRASDLVLELRGEIDNIEYEIEEAGKNPLPR